ncbi:MAG: heme lyase CcmF/NrfE family subunit [Dehalococcoidia bacterium]|nr:heme lyase CcmF/NrfE family subunit [Dehalococcoidia bacterium]
MASDIGLAALVLAMGSAAYAALASPLGMRLGQPALVASGRRAVYVTGAMMLTAFFVLFYSLVSHDFGVAYVAANSSRSQPWYYTWAAMYGGQAGSLLWWATGLGVFASASVYLNRHRLPAVMPYTIAVLMTVLLFFLIILVFLTNPFERLPAALADGRGLNPLLRDTGMLLHPPFLLTGYMSWTVPFGFALGALMAGRLDSQWLRAARPWLLAAWAIQGTGLLLGAWWAYHVLGWGGYWGWDPVENVALLPWLTGTAFLHSIIVQERRGMLKKWNLLLILITFCLAIFGTFVVRGGLLSSVHNFATSALGPAFLAFLGFALVVSLFYFIRRLPLLQSESRFDAIVSRESGFLLNNLLLVGVAFATFWGTIFPLLTEAFNGSRITVGAPFYHKVNGPILLGVLVLMGIGPLLAWRKSTWPSIKRNFRWPLAAVALWTVVMVFGLGITRPWTVAGVAASTFVFGTITLEYYRGVRTRKTAARENYAAALGGLVARNRRRYGGYIVHIAIVLIGLAVIGSHLHQQQMEVTLARGESASIGGYTLTYESLRQYAEGDTMVTEAMLAVQHDGKALTTARPKRVIVNNFESQPTSQIAIHSNLQEDLYVLLATFDENVATFTIFVNPMVIWLWIGGGVFLFGTLVAVWPERAASPATVRHALLAGL